MADVSDGDLAVSPAFVQQVHDLLEHLYDFVYLQKQTLVLPAPQAGRPLLEVPGQKARKLLLDALEKIGEEKGLSFRSSQARIYNLLRLHYIEGMAVQEVAQELGLSQRQTYRDLRSGDERIASIAWANLVGRESLSESLAPAGAVPVVSEGGQLQVEPQFQPTNLTALIGAACDTVRPLAELRSVEFDMHLPRESVVIPTDTMIARQIITGLLSLAIQQALSCPLAIHLVHQMGGYQLQISFRVTEAAEKSPDPSIARYTQDLGWTLQQHGQADQVEITVRIPTRHRTCLVIDDHQGFVELLERYVADYNMRIVMANDGLRGIELAQELQPNVIILDVMMPGMDGWQILQRLHSTPATKAIPVVVCSVFYDPELAFSFEVAADFTSCAPGLLASTCEQFVQVGIRHGDLTHAEASEMLLHTVYGTAKLLLESGEDFDRLIRRVATKGGATEGGVEVLDAYLPDVFEKMFAATLERHEARKQVTRQQFGEQE